MIRGFATHTHSLGLLREFGFTKKAPIGERYAWSKRPIGAKCHVHRLAQPSSLTLCVGGILGIDPDQARLTAINRCFGWPNVSAPFGDGLRLAGRFNVAEPHAHDRHRARLFWKQHGRHICHFRGRKLPGVVVARAVKSWNGPHDHTPWCEVRRLLIERPPRPGFATARWSSLCEGCGWVAQDDVWPKCGSIERVTKSRDASQVDIDNTFPLAQARPCCYARKKVAESEPSPRGERPG
jgi:hypothetical protein